MMPKRMTLSVDDQGTSPADDVSSLWMAPGTVVLVVLINMVILGYAIYYVAHYTSQNDSSHMAVQTPPQAGSTGNTAAASDGSAAVLPVVENTLNLPPEAEVRKMYVQHCAACHGLGEKGDGPAAVWLFPQPRNFLESSFRFAATGGSHDEVIAGLENTIAKGIPRSAMPGFKGVLSEEYIAGLAHYVLDFQKDKQPPQQVKPVQLGERPPTTSELVQRGATLYKTIGCVTCHGENGSGEGLASIGMVDSLGRPIVAADFRQGLYKSGSEPAQLARTIVHGVPGTPMNSYEAVLVKPGTNGGSNATDVWALVAYVQSFAGKGQPEGISSGGEIHLQERSDLRILQDAAHPAWLGITPVTIRLQPLWRRDQTPAILQVRAVHIDGQIAVCFDWNDATMDLIKDQGKFSDAVAMMLALGDDVPALPMGVSIPGFIAKEPVNIWHWQAHRQPPDDDMKVNAISQNGKSSPMHLFKLAPDLKPKVTTTEPATVLPEYRTAQAAENVLAELDGYPALESNAIGFGTLKLQPADSQKLRSTALWTNGHWRVVISRPWTPQDENDVVFEGRYKIPVAFASWDGSNGDRGGKKVVSGWHWLIVNEPPAPKTVTEPLPNVDTSTEVPVTP